MISRFAKDQGCLPWQEDLEYLVNRIEIMHPNPYAYISREKFHRLKDGLSSRIPEMDEADIVIAISELLARLHDGHTRMRFDLSDSEWLDRTFHLLPLILYPFDDGVHVLAALPGYKEWAGAKVLRIGKMPIEKAAEKLEALYSHDNSSGGRKSLYYTLGFAEMLRWIGAVETFDKIDVALRKTPDRVTRISVETVPFSGMARYLGSWYPQVGSGLSTMNETSENPLPLWLKRRESFWYEYLPAERTMFLQINSLNSPRGNEAGTFGHFCEDFFKAFDQSCPERLVIDIRANNGGNHVELPLLKGILARPAIDRPDKVFLITGRVTYSAAVHFTTIFRRYTNATTIGEPTSGRPNHYGAIRSFKLPNHPEVVIGCSIDYYQDSDPFDFNTTHTPDIMTRMTAADYRDNIDPAMNAVKDYNKIIARVRGLEEVLKKEYFRNGFAAMKQAYEQDEQELVDSGYNPEKFLLDFRSNWFNENKKSAADYLEYLVFAFGKCTGSIDLCYFLASQFEEQGRVDEAAKQYQQCLLLNPSCHYARMKLGLLELK